MLYSSRLLIAVNDLLRREAGARRVSAVHSNWVEITDADAVATLAGTVEDISCGHCRLAFPMMPHRHVSHTIDECSSHKAMLRTATWNRTKQQAKGGKSKKGNKPFKRKWQGSDQKGKAKEARSQKAVVHTHNQKINTKVLPV